MKTIFVPFSKVLEAQQEVWGLVTAEVPDKENEVCDYEGSKPYYQAVIDEFTKATNGANMFPLRAMHQLKAAGKCINVDFRDSDKEIHMGFKVVDKDEWQKVLEDVYTGFSHGGTVVGKMWADPDFKNCQRYIVSPSEVSLVDNPCLGVAHYTMVRANGAVELVKLRSVYDVPLIGKAGKTKEVDGEALPPSAFAYVGDPDKVDTWHLPIKFSSEEKTKKHIRLAIAMFSLTGDIPESEKDKVWEKIVRAAKAHDIQVSSEKGAAAVSTAVVVGNADKVSLALERAVPKALKAKLAEWKVEKGMYAVQQLAALIQDLAYLVISAKYEAELEDDGSDLPEALLEDLKNIIETFRDQVVEETEELAANAEAGGGGAIYMATTANNVVKAAKGHFKKTAVAHEKLAAVHADQAEEHGAMAKALEACKATEPGHEHCKVTKSFHKAMAAHSEKASKEHGKIADAMGAVGDAEEGNEKAAPANTDKATSDTTVAAPAVVAIDAAVVKAMANAAAAAVKAAGGDQAAQTAAAESVTKAAVPAAPAATVVAANGVTDMSILVKNAMAAIGAEFMNTGEFKTMAKAALLEQFKTTMGGVVKPTDVRVTGIKQPQLIQRAGTTDNTTEVPLDLQDFTETVHADD